MPVSASILLGSFVEVYSSSKVLFWLQLRGQFLYTLLINVLGSLSILYLVKHMKWLIMEELLLLQSR